MALSVGAYQYVFFSTDGEPVNLVVTTNGTTDGTNAPTPIAGDYNIELVTFPPANNGFPSPTGFDGLASFPNGPSQQLNLVWRQHRRE